LNRKRLVMMALTTGVLMLTLSAIASVAAYGTVSGWGRVGSSSGPATLSMKAGSLPGHEGKKFVLLTVDGITYGWEITRVRPWRDCLIVYAKSLGGHAALGVEPGPGFLVAIVKGHGSSNRVIAFGRSTFFIGS
jgi:hypothetical protein